MCASHIVERVLKNLSQILEKLLKNVKLRTALVKGAAPSCEAQLPLRAFVAGAEGTSERHRVATRRRSEDLQRKPPRLRCTGADGTADAHHIGSKAVPVLLSKAVIEFERG